MTTATGSLTTPAKAGVQYRRSRKGGLRFGLHRTWTPAFAGLVSSFARVMRSSARLMNRKADGEC